MRLAVVAALSLAGCAHRIAAQSCDDLEEQLRVCRLQEAEPSPTTPAPDTGFICDGILSRDGRTCCAPGCGEICGGVGCSDRGGGLTADDCCVSSIQGYGQLCSLAGKAPCVVSAGDPAPAPVSEPPLSAPTTTPATSSPEPAPVVEQTPAPYIPASPVPAPILPTTSSPEPAPVVEPTPVPRTPQTEPPASAGGGDGWVPKVGDTWQYNLDTPVDTDVDVDVFLIDMDGAQKMIEGLHEKGKWVSCYISIGSLEPWREDAHLFPDEAIGGELELYPDERFVDINNERVREIMVARVKKAAGMSCDAVEPDNMSNWNQPNTGLIITRDEQLAYNKWFAELVHVEGMVVGLKNAFELVGDLSGFFDFAISSQCHEFNECDVYTVPFVENDKPVFNVEYRKDYGVCAKSISLGIDTIFKNFDLKAPMCSCTDSSRDLDCDDVVGYTDAPAPTPPTPAAPTPTPPTTPSPVSFAPSTPEPAPLTSETPAPTPPAPSSPTSTPAPAPLASEPPAPPTPTTPAATPSPVSSEPSTPVPAPLASETPAPTTPVPTTPPATPSPVTAEPSTPAPVPTPDGGGSWVPRVGDRWQYNLKPPVDTDVDADIFFIGTVGEEDTIKELHSKGKWVSCYISTGTVESWREDAGAFPSEAIGNSYPGWDGEKYLDITQQSVRDIMLARIEKAADMGCDAIEPDNMSNYNQPGTGFEISEEEQIQYNRWIAETIHDNGMKAGMKNAIELLDATSEYYDFAINEECHEWDECDAYTLPFVSKGKPVFNVEYIKDYNMCVESNAIGMDTIFKNYDLDTAFCSCADSSRDVGCSSI